jgi:hypothetical protein
VSGSKIVMPMGYGSRCANERLTWTASACLLAFAVLATEEAEGGRFDDETTLDADDRLMGGVGVAMAEARRFFVAGGGTMGQQQNPEIGRNAKNWSYTKK